MQHSSVRGSLGGGKGDAKAVKWMTKTREIAVARHLSQHTRTMGYMSNWKHAPMMEITSPKPARMRSDKRKRKQSGENESVGQMNTSGGWRVGGGRGYRVKLDIEFSIFPRRSGWSSCGGGGSRWSRRTEYQSLLKVRIKFIRGAFSITFLHMPGCRALWQWAVGFDSIKLRSCAKLWPRRGRERNAAGIGGSTEQGEWEREVHLSWQGFQFLFTFLLLGPKCEEPILNRLPRHGRGNGKDFNVDLRQPFSSLLSKQSGNPSHCHPPGTHLPSAHMKFPGMLHSVVTLLPGSSWLSGGEEGSRWLPTIFLDRYHICNVTIFNAFKTGQRLLNAETEVCLWRHLKLAPSAETLNTETPNPRLWKFGLTQQLPAGAEWAGMWNATFLAEVWHLSVRASPKTILGSREECGGFRQPRSYVNWEQRCGEWGRMSLRGENQLNGRSLLTAPLNCSFLAMQ